MMFVSYVGNLMVSFFVEYFYFSFSVLYPTCVQFT